MQERLLTKTPRPVRLFVPAIAFCAIAAASVMSAAPSTWDAGSAAAYLDARMDTWWANAKVLKTGDKDVRCLSCHTAVPYVLARPALRRMLNQAAPTPHEARILDTVRARVASLDNQQPFYDHTEDKKIESRGAEAVLNAFVLTNHDLEMKAAEPSSGTRAAMDRLWSVQRQDGAWDWLNFGLEPYESADAVFYGATLAALAAGSAPGMAASQTEAALTGRGRLQRYLSTQAPSQRLFNRAWALLAASRLPEALTVPQRLAIVRDLLAAQRADGGWSMIDLGPWRWNGTSAPFAAPGRTDNALLSAADGYATGLVVYALRQARAGADGATAVAKGQQWLRAHQAAGSNNDPAWAPWRAHSFNFDREHGGPKGEPWRRLFMSDLATAFAVLALAE